MAQVTTEDYSSTEVPGGSEDRESYTLHGINDVYENVDVANNRTNAERYVFVSPGKNTLMSN